MGHDVIGMEQYVAEGSKPLDRCVEDVMVADLYLLILAWRYGYRPIDSAANPQKLSLTELEFEAAKPNKPVLAFLLDPQAPWPPSEMDAFSSNAEDAASILRLRSQIGSRYLAGIFRTPDDLASQAAAAVAIQGLGQQLVDRLLGQTSVSAEHMGRFGGGDPLQDSTIMSIKQMVRTAGPVRAVIIDLGDGDNWWSTRLFLLASLFKSLTAVRQLVFRDSSGHFSGMASPGAVIDGLSTMFRQLDDFRRQVEEATPAGAPSQDTEREIDRQINLWNTQAGLNERNLKVGMRPELLQGWLGERLINRCIYIEKTGPTMTQVQQIVDSFLPDVPIERPGLEADPMKPMLQVVDRDAFALELAREWVRTGLPRTPLRLAGLG